MISVSGYPQVPIAAESATVRLEITAPGHKGVTMDYRVTPGDNPIALALESTGELDLKSATVAFTGAPQGTMVKCQGARCPDAGQHPITDVMEFSLGETDEDNKVVFAFNAPGYRTKINVYILKPGRNKVPVKMDAVRPDGSGE
jgi:hypothetical protein